jgi:hypothetical protein
MKVIVDGDETNRHKNIPKNTVHPGTMLSLFDGSGGFSLAGRMAYTPDVPCGRYQHRPSADQTDV